MEFATLVAVGLLLLLLVGWVAKRVHQWVQEWGVDISGGVRLPPGEMGLPVIGNMWAFLRAYKWGQPDSFMGSFIQRSVISHVTFFFILCSYSVIRIVSFKALRCLEVIA